jgi:hypothetical protein
MYSVQRQTTVQKLWMEKKKRGEDGWRVIVGRNVFV